MSAVISVVRGTDVRLDLTFKDAGGTAFDITGWTVFFTVKRRLDYSSDSGAVISEIVSSHTDPTNGRTTLSLSHADLAIAPRGYYYGIQVVRADGQVSESEPLPFIVKPDTSFGITGPGGTAPPVPPSAAAAVSVNVTITDGLGIAVTILGGGTGEPPITPGTTSQYWRGDKTWQTLDKTAVGLGNVTNTSDANKPVSTAQQAALDAQQAQINTKRVADVVTVDPSGTYGADFAVTSYADAPTAINAAITAAKTAGKRYVKLLGDMSTVYTVGAAPILLPSDFVFEAAKGVTLRMRNNASGTNPIAIKNEDQAAGNQNITLVNITGDGNGTNQVAAQSVGGAFLNFVGVDNLRYEGLRIYGSIRFNSFVSTVDGATLTGTLALTMNSTSVVGTSTAFTSQLAVGQRIRSGAGSLSFPIEKIVDDTHLVFTEPWPHATEASSASCKLVRGVKVTAINSYFGTTYENDTFGGGGWDNSYFDDCTFENAQGYGFGTSSMYNSDLIGLHTRGNQNGFGLERVARSRVIGGSARDNSQNGVYLVNGSHNNHIIGVHASGNGVGFFDGNTSATKGYNSRNTFTDCKALLNQTHGYSFLGSQSPNVAGCLTYNNNQSNSGSAHGMYFHSANGFNTTSPKVSRCRGFDDQGVATQTRDIYFDTGCTDAAVDFVGFNVISGPTAPNYSPNMRITGGGKQIAIISGSTRATSNYETYVLCNQDAFAHLLPRLNSIVDGHKVKYIYNGAGTPVWTFARSTSDSFGTLEDYAAIPQDGHFWVEWCWDNTTKRWFISGTNQTAALDTKQPLDADLTAIAALAPPDDNVLQRKGGVWVGSTPAQLKADLALIDIFNFGTPVSTTDPTTVYSGSTNSLATPTTFWGSFARPYPTNVWWQNLVLGTSTNMLYAHPYQLKALTTGLDVNYPNTSYGNMTVDANGKSITTAFHKNVSFGMAETITNRLVTAYDDLTVTERFQVSGNTTYMDAFIAKGSPYVTVKYAGLTPQINTQHAITNVNGTTSFPANITGTKFKIVLNNGQTWILYFGSSVTLNVQNSGGWRMLASTTYSDTVRAALLANAADETMLDTYKTCYPISGVVGALVSEDISYTSFNWATAGTGSLLMLALPHHQDTINGQTLLATFYATLIGPMKGVVGTVWVMREALPTITWAAPKGIDPTKLDIVEAALGADKTYVPGNASAIYEGGKDMAKAARLMLIAEQLGDADALSNLTNNLKPKVQAWLNSTGSNTLRYDSTWGGIATANGLASSSNEYGNGLYNDHHFHWGYLIYAAAVIAKFDRNWMATYREKINMVVRDIMNPSALDTYFPRFRMMDWYDGHSWAHGLAESASGKDQESFSEAINAWYSIVLWGLAVGDRNIKEHGRILLAKEIRGMQKYVQITDSSIYPAPFSNNKTAGILFAGKVDHTTFFGSNLEFVNEINTIPVTPILEASQTLAYATASYAETTDLLNRAPTLTSSVSGGAVTAVNITSLSANNKGYNAYPPTIGFSGGGGSGAAATAVITAGELTGITVTSGGTGYTTPPTVTISQGVVSDGWKGFVIAKRAIYDPVAAWTAALSLSTFDEGNSKTNELYWIATRTGPANDVLAAQGFTPTAVKSAAYTAAPGDFVPVDTTGGAVAITLPKTPADKTRVGVKMVIQGGTNATTVVTSGTDVFNKIGGGTTLTLSLVNQAAILQYNALTGVWYVQSTDVPLSQTDTRYAQVSNNLSDLPSPSTARTNLGLGSFATKSTGVLGTDITSPAVDFSMASHALTDVADPFDAQDAATKHYVDSVAGVGAPDATGSVKGILKLAGDLGGTASIPTVPGLTSKLNKAGDTMTGELILAAGTASAGTEPIRFQTGTSLTTPEAGAMEFDGKIFYGTPTSGNRHVLDGEQFITLTNTYTLANNTNLQQLFNAPVNGQLTLAANTAYFFECCFSITGLSSSSHTIGFGFGGTATLTRQRWEAIILAAGALGTVAAAQCSLQTATAAITTAVTSTGLLAKVFGKIVVGTGGTIIPSIQQNTASTAGVVGIDSYFRIWPVGLDSVQSVGNWS